VFTGIVEEVGTVVVREDQDDAAVLRIRARKVLDDVALGDSIAVNGVCLTVTGVDDGVWSTDVMGETLRRSSLRDATAGEPVNLERAVTPHTRLGGHLMQGHVDGVGHIVARTPGEHWEVVRIGLPRELARYVVEKGSIAVDGVSLTVSAVSDVPGPDAHPDADAWFEVSLIPTTLRETTLGGRAPGESVNLEVDVIAKYVERLLGGASGNELASSRKDTAPSGTTPTSASEEES
jgi:riboflavin synthase